MKKICRFCGIEYDGKQSSSACPDCAKKSRRNVIHPRVCGQCGASFDGGPRAFYCPDCRKERQRMRARLYYKDGHKRHIGGTDFCSLCGKPYTIKAPQQRYCPDCGAITTKENIKSHGLYLYHSQTEEERKEIQQRKKAANVPRTCVICGKQFPPRTNAKTCSPECSMELKQQTIMARKRMMKSKRYD